MGGSTTGRLLFLSHVKPEVTVDLFKLIKHKETKTTIFSSTQPCSFGARNLINCDSFTSLPYDDEGLIRQFLLGLHNGTIQLVILYN